MLHDKHLCGYSHAASSLHDMTMSIIHSIAIYTIVTHTSAAKDHDGLTPSHSAGTSLSIRNICRDTQPPSANQSEISAPPVPTRAQAGATTVCRLRPGDSSTPPQHRPEMLLLPRPKFCPRDTTTPIYLALHCETAATQTTPERCRCTDVGCTARTTPGAAALGRPIVGRGSL